MEIAIVLLWCFGLPAVLAWACRIPPAAEPSEHETRPDRRPRVRMESELVPGGGRLTWRGHHHRVLTFKSWTDVREWLDAQLADR